MYIKKKKVEVKMANVFRRPYFETELWIIMLVGVLNV